MLVHQHRWVADQVWDLVVTMDDATGEHTSMFMCDQEGTASSFHGIGQTIARYGLFASLYSDRGSHYFTTPEAGGKVTDPMQRVPDLPFGHLNITWLAFLAKKKFDYKLQSFAIPPREENKASIALRGYAWVRLGTVKAEFFYEWAS